MLVYQRVIILIKSTNIRIRIENMVCLKTGSLQTAIVFQSIQNGKCFGLEGGASHGQWFFLDKFYQLLENIDVSPLRIMSFDVLCLYSKGASQLFWGPFGHFWMQPSGHKTRMRWIHNWQIWLFNLKNVHTFCGSIGTSFGAILNI